MPARRKSGFTLIELLVVIAIIAILAAILFPVFARAREAARKSTCQNNIKECAVSLQLYWNDYDATLPSSRCTAVAQGTAGAPTDAQRARFASELGQIPPITGTTTLSNNPQTWPAMLYGHMKNKDIMFCPSDSAATDKTIATGTVSYWWKYAIDRAWNDSAIMAMKESDYGYGSDQIVLFEHMGWHFGESAGLKNSSQINVAFLDSHVRTVNLTCAGDVAQATTTTFPASMSAVPGYEPFYFNFNNDVAGAASAGAYFNPRIYSDKL